MRRRISIRMLTAWVAIAALMMAGAVLVERWSEFRARVERQADFEMASLEYADDARGQRGDPQRVAGDVSRGRDSLAKAARAELHGIRDLAVGKPCPEIAGEDIDGKPFKLSDYRGKVVVVDFWGDW
jgi:hypothetical protein